MTNPFLKDIIGGILDEAISKGTLETLAKRLQDGSPIHINIPFEGLELGDLSNGLAGLDPEKLREAFQKQMGSNPFAPKGVTVEDIQEQIRAGNPVPSGILVETPDGVKPLTAELMKEILHNAMNGQPFSAKVAKPENEEKPQAVQTEPTFKSTPPPEFQFGEATKVDTVQPATMYPNEKFAGGTIVSRRKVGDIPYSMEQIEENIRKAQDGLKFWADMQTKKQQEVEEKDQKAALIAELNLAYEEIANLEKILLEYNENLGLLLISEPAGVENKLAQMQHIAKEIASKKAIAEELRLFIERIQQV